MSNPNSDFSSQSATEAALRLAGRLIDAIGPRPSGSAASRQAADALQAEAATFADRTWSEDFPVHPGAFLGWIRVLVLLYIAGVALLWLELFWLAALLAALGIVILVAQFFFYRELLESFYPRQTGRNVLAKPIAFLTGGTDAGELARGGAQATTLIGMPWGNNNRSNVYHTLADVLSAVSPQAVAVGIELAVDLAGELDAGLGA